MKKVKYIVLDFGHGGIDANGIYTTAPAKMFTFPNNEVAYEGKLNREIGKELFEMLDNQPEFETILTVHYDNPEDVLLNERVKITNKYPKDETLFISIHCNAGGGTGFELFTTNGNTESDILAESIATQVELLYNSINKKLRFDYTDGDKDKESDFYVLRKSLCPAVLLECGFFDNYEEFKLLSDPIFQKNLAIQFFIGIMNYLQDYDRL